MNLRKTVTTRLFKLAQSPQVMELAANPRLMGALLKLLALRGQLSTAAGTATDSLARSLGLATRDEVRELRRTVRRLEELLRQEQESRDAERASAGGAS